MKSIFLLSMALLLSASTASAAMTEKWTVGWDNFSEPLNFTNSNITCSRVGDDTQVDGDL
jgi:hypothetical protein